MNYEREDETGIIINTRNDDMPRNLDNLKKGEATRFKAGEKQVEISRRAAEKSARVRRERKTAKQVAEMVLSSMPKLGKNAVQAMESMGFDPETDTMTIYTVIGFAMAQKAMKGDVKAGQMLLEMGGESAQAIAATERLRLEKERLKLERKKLELEKERLRLQADRIDSDSYEGPLICDSMEEADDDPSA